jgi:hypothetical protein
VIVGGGEEEDSTQQSIGVNRFIMLWWAEGGKDKTVVDWYDGCRCCFDDEWVG